MATSAPTRRTEPHWAHPPRWLGSLTAAVRSGAAHSDLPHHARFLTNNEDNPEHSRRYAAVLMLLAGDSPEQGDILLTHRAPHLSTHAGQVSFPGGRIDDSDRDVVDTALREAWEETGLAPASVSILGTMDPVYIPRTNYEVTPVLGYWPDPGTFGIASPDEAVRVMRVPLSLLIDPAQRFMVGRGNWYGPAFWYDNLVIWGFTAGLLDTLIRSAGWEIPWSSTQVHDLTEILSASGNNEKILTPAQLAERSRRS